VIRALLLLLAAVVARLPWSVLEAPGAAVGWIFGSVLRVRRAAVEAAMGRAGVRSPADAAGRMYRGLGTGIVELLWLAGARDEARQQILRERVTLTPALVAAIDRALRRGPLVFAASHTANWELVAAGAAHHLRARGHGLAAIVKPMSVHGVHAFCTYLREALGLSLLSPAGALAAARDVLSRGDALAMVIDQVPDRAEHGTKVRFLGADALVDRGPATVARTAHATLLVVAGRRDGRDQVVELLEEIPPPEGAAGVARAATSATLALETFVQNRPHEWMWLHRRWRAPRRGTSVPPAIARLVADRRVG